MDFLVQDLDLPFVVFAFLPDDAQGREVVFESFDEVGLDLVVCLGGKRSTSVTGSSIAFSYFFR